jgi:GT2 family glycosyltransferase
MPDNTNLESRFDLKIWIQIGSAISALESKFSRRQVSLRQFAHFSKHHASTHEPEFSIPKISVIIPTRDKPEMLEKCIQSVKNTTQKLEVEIIVIDNGSKEYSTKKLFSNLQSQGIRLLHRPGKFNYSELCNFAVGESTGEIICFLNNDTIATSENWLRSMAIHAQYKDVGLVGAVLLYEDQSIQHMGIALGYNGLAGHPFQGSNPEECVPKDCFEVSAVTFACAVIERKKFELIGLLDTKFPVGFNDVDFAIRSSSMGLSNLVCTRAVLMHLESQTRPRTKTLVGFVQALKDFLRLLIRHPQGFVDKFFSA